MAQRSSQSPFLDFPESAPRDDRELPSVPPFPPPKVPSGTLALLSNRLKFFCLWLLPPRPAPNKHRSSFCGTPPPCSTSVSWRSMGLPKEWSLAMRPSNLGFRWYFYLLPLFFLCNFHSAQRGLFRAKRPFAPLPGLHGDQRTLLPPSFYV